ncbi:uncharacterized protein DS421_15g508870 [Arachis hypogaea]|nr:uncharacterized protein DS421_15g508870 [Arachis hypogaea]
MFEMSNSFSVPVYLIVAHSRESIVPFSAATPPPFVSDAIVVWSVTSSSSLFKDAAAPSSHQLKKLQFSRLGIQKALVEEDRKNHKIQTLPIMIHVYEFRVYARMEKEDVVSYFHGAAAMADKDLYVGDEEELVSDDPDVCLGDEPSSEVEFGGFYQYFLHLFTRTAWFVVLFLILLHDEKYASFALKLLYFDPLLLSFDAVTCLLSDFRNYRARMA